MFCNLCHIVVTALVFCSLLSFGSNFWCLTCLWFFFSPEVTCFSWLLSAASLFEAWTYMAFLQRVGICFYWTRWGNTYSGPVEILCLRLCFILSVRRTHIQLTKSQIRKNFLSSLPWSLSILEPGEVHVSLNLTLKVPSWGSSSMLALPRCSHGGSASKSPGQSQRWYYPHPKRTL